LGVNSPAELFEKFYEIFVCIKWKVDNTPGKVIARGDRCLLCAIAKKTEVVQPCSLYCINPFAALAAEMKPGWNLFVNETLWDGKKCEFELIQVN
jgi:hypothetical protein